VVTQANEAANEIIAERAGFDWDLFFYSVIYPESDPSDEEAEIIFEDGHNYVSL
jgi:hypothetical protein